MPDTTPTLADALKVVDGGIKLNISGTLPGEALITAIMAYSMQVRATMDPALLKRWDAVTVQQVEDVQHVWRGIWKALGVVE
jgi:hypothetical protein